MQTSAAENSGSYNAGDEKQILASVFFLGTF